jgi:hypothetical protein
VSIQCPDQADATILDMTKTARSRAAVGDCKLVEYLALHVCEQAPEFCVRVFIVDPVIQRCWSMARTRDTARAAAPDGGAGAGEPRKRAYSWSDCAEWVRASQRALAMPSR